MTIILIAQPKSNTLIELFHGVENKWCFNPHTNGNSNDMSRLNWNAWNCLRVLLLDDNSMISSSGFVQISKNKA